MPLIPVASTSRLPTIWQLARRCYKRALVKEICGPLVVEETAEPLPVGDTEVLVTVESAGLNHADYLMVNGLHHARIAVPGVPGFEFAGQVKEVGSKVESFSIGDRVLGLKTSSTGAFAEECIGYEKTLYPIPHSLSYEMAASIPVAYLTALLALEKYAHVKAGETVLVLTSSGSTGTAAVDLALNVFKCKVISASDNDEKMSVLRKKGVLRTIDYDNENMVKMAKSDLTGGEGVDVVVDTVGGIWTQEAMQCLKPGGRLCLVGFSSGKIPTLSSMDIQRHQISVHGIWLGGFARRYPDEFRKHVERVINLLDEQYIAPTVDSRFSLDQINEAFAYVAHRPLGKTVINMR